MVTATTATKTTTAMPAVMAVMVVALATAATATAVGTDNNQQSTLGNSGRNSNCGVGGGGRRRIEIGHTRRAAGDIKMMWSDSMEDTKRRSGAAGHRGGSRRRRPTMGGVRVATM